jgi:phosphate uptake regulator
MLDPYMKAVFSFVREIKKADQEEEAYNKIIRKYRPSELFMDIAVRQLEVNGDYSASVCLRYIIHKNKKED